MSYQPLQWAQSIDEQEAAIREELAYIMFKRAVANQDSLHVALYHAGRAAREYRQSVNLRRAIAIERQVQD